MVRVRVSDLVLEVGDDGVADGGGLELLKVEGTVEALDRHLHRRLAHLLVAEEREQRVDHEATADGGRVGARGLELLLELGHHLLEGLLGLVEAELRRGERDLLVRLLRVRVGVRVRVRVGVRVRWGLGLG